MSFNAEDLENTNIDDLDDKQIKVLDDWIKTYEEKKMYPIVGQLTRIKVHLNHFHQIQ